MRIAALVARILLGVMFVVFGLNGFLNFIHQPPPANPLAQQFFMAMVASHFMAAVFVVQVLGGLILLSGRYTAAGLALLAPVIFNILNYHVTMDPKGIPPAILAAILWGIAVVPVRGSFLGLLSNKRTVPSAI